MSTITKKTFQFLKELKQNNNREWFLENKSRYEEAKKEFETFIDALIAEISKFDRSISHHTAKDCVFRIYRDVRFSKDKSPYKTHLGAHITSAAKKSEIHSRAGYYIHIGPGESMLAGGAYLPQGPWIKAIRQEIAYNADDLRKIINGKKFKEYFGAIEGEKLKKAPKDYEADHPEIELLKYKSFLASHKCSDGTVTSKEFLQHSAEVFKALYPFDEFLNRAID
ncbi:MAG: DUF2461 domain-containing protein [Cytophagales bacterium]|nr:DUF2461 domain-containing protein [Cytophagales bacterium]